MKEVIMNYAHLGLTVKDGWNCNEWDITLEYDDKIMELPYFTGIAIDEPTIDDVIHSLLMDSKAVDVDFEEWCHEFGYDEDSRKAEKLYNDCIEIGNEFKEFLGDDYEKFEKKYEDY